ncbi:unnamed protein product [Caenorhabditis auriculariae]|uniref:Aminopeptidase n=1 Tax=Caenorhabditis auriculariae TaxID=2777116 RepID=A0A8S1GX41_9PELO|nr:unnamed protein product [Caenorhabditis auriculariae]
MLPIWLLLGFALLGATSADFSHPAVVPDLQLKNSHLTKSSLTKRINLLERLPASLTAIHYDIWIKPYFPAPGVTYDPSRDFTFDAKTTVRVKATEDAGSIVLNARYLNFSSYSVVRNDGQTVPIHGFYYNDTTEQIILSPRSVTIQKGSVYDVSFVYTGLINYYQDGGLFYTNYVDPSGQKHWMVATQFESTDARRVFPGLDEPSYKATFSITVAYPTSLVVLSNMYEDDPTTLDNGYSQVAFPNTPRMATYLVAFAIGPFVSFEYMNEDHTLVRSWGWPGTEQYLSFAAMNAGFCLYQMGQYTGMQYPLEKSAGAMENWGLVIYKYQYIAYNPTTMTTADMENAVKVICHELAHQWFGDLVTLAWWDDLFLNEGFADYFMRYIQGKVYPNQAVYLDTLHVREELEYALQADIAPSAHPLVAPDGPHFDLITYRKGSSMLRMLSDVLGEDVFQAGLKSYLYIYQYSNANHEYLFDALTEAAQEARVTDWCGRPFNVSVFMEPYVHQTNFPLINFVNNDFNHYATFSQDPFQNSSSLPQTDWNYYWPIPLRTVRYDNYSYVQQWIVPSNQACTGVGEKKALHWEVADITTAAYGRVKYDDVGFDRLIQKLQTQSIPPQVMVTLLGDEIAYIARQQATNAPFSYDRFLTLAVSVFNIQSFIHQPSFSAGDVAYSTLEAISTQLRDHMDYPLIKRLHEKIFSNSYQHIPWINTDDWDKDTFQASFLPLAVRLNIGDSANRTLQMFAKIKTACAQSSNGTAWCNPIPTNFRRAVYCGAVKNSVQMANDNFAQVLQYYNAEVVTNPYFYQEYLALLEGLTCTEASSTLKVTIRLFLKSPLNPNVIFSWFKTNPYASDALASYLNDRPSEVLNFTGLDAYLDAMTYNWRSEKRFLQLNRILNTLQLNTAQQRVFNKYLLRTQQQVTYNTRYLPRLLNWLYDNLVVRGETPWTQRVSDALVPTSYQLTLQPFIPGSGSYDFWSNMTFTAFLTMEFDLIVPVQEIQLTAHRLLIDVSTIYLTDGTNNTILLDTGIRKDYDNAFLYIPSPTTLQEGHYTLTMSYQGLIFNKPSDGVDSNWNFYEFDGKQGWIFTTDFEGGPSVRSLLPCIDEPSYKAEFTVSLIHPADMTALSNTLDTGMTILDKGWAQTTFQTTPKMSSYLLAICFGHFSSVSKVSNTGVLVRLFTWTGMERYGDFGLQVMAGTVDFMATYFNYPFPLPKLGLY